MSDHTVFPIGNMTGDMAGAASVGLEQSFRQMQEDRLNQDAKEIASATIWEWSDNHPAVRLNAQEWEHLRAVIIHKIEEKFSQGDR